MASMKQIDRAIKQAKDLAESLKTIGTMPNAQKDAAAILARLETLRDLRVQESIDRGSNRIED